MAAISWTGVSGDWTQASDWSGGSVPGAADNVTIGGAGAFVMTLYSATPVGSVVMNAANALFYDAGALTLGGVFALQAGTLALANGSLTGGTLALSGGTLLAEGGTLSGVAVQGALNLSQAYATLFVQGGLAMAGAGGAGAGSVALTGQYAGLTFLGTQTLANAVVTLGATGAGPGQGGAATLTEAAAYGGTGSATLTLGANVWVNETGTLGQIIAGSNAGGPGGTVVVNQGTITAAAAGSTLTIGGAGAFINQGTLAVSNGATLDIASAGFTNTGTVAVANATLDFGGTFASSLLGSLGKLGLSQGTIEIGGTLLNAGATLSIGASTALGPLDLVGTIAGGTVADSGGGLNLAAGTGALDGVTYQGTLALGAGAVLTLLDRTSLVTAGGGAGTASITGAGAALLLEGATALNGATIAIGGSTGVASLGTADAWLASAATTATLGPQLVVQQTGKFAAVDANATTPFAGYGLSDTLVNQGSITGAFAGGTLLLGGYGTLINQGSIAVSNGDTLDIAPGLFSNTGTITIASGATAILGGPANLFGQAPAWSNTGLISLSGGTLVLAGAMRTAQLGQIGGTGGQVTLAGTLANTGATLTLGTGGESPGLTLAGTIQGGTIQDAAGVLTAGTGGAALLNGVAYAGTLNVAGADAWLRVVGGLSVNGRVNITGAGSELAFTGSQVFNGAQVFIGAAGTAATLDILQDPAAYAASTLTLGSGLDITQAGALAVLGTPGDTTGDAIVSDGAITAAVAGGTFTLGGAGFTNAGSISVSNGDTLALTTAVFRNAGTITITNAALALDDAVSLAALGALQLNDAAVSIAGDLNATGGTLSIGAGSGWGRVSLTGTITGGTIVDAGGGLNAAGMATLSGVTYDGILDLSRPFQQLAVANGIKLGPPAGSQTGTIMLTGAGSRLVASTSESLANATVYVGSASETYLGQHIPAPELDAGANATLTIAAGAMVRTAGAVGTLGDCALGGWTDVIVNDGTVLAASAGGTLNIGASFFTNAGGVVAGNDGNVLFTGVDFSNTNTGAISLTGGSTLGFSLYGYYAAPDSGPTVFSNAGTIHMLGGMLDEYTGNGLFPAVPMLNAPGGLIQGFGNVIGPVLNAGTIEARFGPNLDLAGAITGSGLLQIDTGCVLELGGAVASSQTVRFTATGETLRLDAPAGFAGAVANLTSGDAIDVAGSPVNTVAISAGTLVLGTSYGVFKLNSTALLGGAVSVGADHHGGDAVLYTAQSVGGGGTGGGTATILGVAQPKMLFWASPIGDEFQGATANLNGAQIANWATADSLDFVDMLGTRTTVLYAQATGQGTITVTDGTHSASIGLLGSYNATWFHVTADAHGGALVTYSHP